jgi:hypothetical protein
MQTPTEPSRPISPDALRPGQRWYLYAVLFALALIVAGPGAFVLGVLGATGSAEIAGGRFASGLETTVLMTPEVEKSIYASDNARGPCTATGPGTAVLDYPQSEHVVMGTDGRTWRFLGRLVVREAGEYRVVCGAPDAAGWYSIRDSPSAAGCLGGCLGGTMALFVLPLFGIAGGIAIAVVVWVKRDQHRKRLLAA